MANKIRSAERNKINNAARDLLPAPMDWVVKVLMKAFGISRTRAEGSMARAARRKRNDGR